MIGMLRLTIILMFAGLCHECAFCQKPGCTTAQEIKAGNEADSLRTWDALYRSYHRFASCDDGAIAEGYSDSVGRLLAEHWDTLSRFSQLSRQDVGFRRFVRRHIDDADFVKIRDNALRRCPSGSARECKDIRNAAEKAIEYQHEQQS